MTKFRLFSSNFRLYAVFEPSYISTAISTISPGIYVGSSRNLGGSRTVLHTGWGVSHIRGTAHKVAHLIIVAFNAANEVGRRVRKGVHETTQRVFELSRHCRGLIRDLSLADSLLQHLQQRSSEKNAIQKGEHDSPGDI